MFTLGRIQKILVSVRESAGILVSVAGALLAVAVLSGGSHDPGMPKILYRLALWLGIAIVCLLVVLWPLDELFKYFGRQTRQSFRAAKRDELQEMLPFYGRIVGGEMPSINQLKDIHNANGECFRFYEQAIIVGGQKTTEIKGFCTIVPVTSDAMKLLDNEQLNGFQLNKIHIVKPRVSCAAIYVGSIGGDGPKARAAVLNYVLGQLQVYASSGIAKVYTRPITKNGLGVAKKHGFHPVKSDAGPDELGRLYFLDLIDDPPPVRKRRSTRKTVQVDTAAPEAAIAP